MGAPSPTTLREYAAAYRLHVVCPACDREAPLNLMRWAQLVGWDTPLQTLRHAIRCGDCGNNIGMDVRLTRLGDDAALPGR